MSKVKIVKTKHVDERADEIVLAQAHDETSWGNVTHVVPRLMPTSIRLNSRTIERAKFFARIHRERGYQTWLKRVIEERVNTEYEMYRRLQKEAVA